MAAPEQVRSVSFQPPMLLCPAQQPRSRRSHGQIHWGIRRRSAAGGQLSLVSKTGAGPSITALTLAWCPPDPLNDFHNQRRYDDGPQHQCNDRFHGYAATCSRLMAAGISATGSKPAPLFPPPVAGAGCGTWPSATGFCASSRATAMSIRSVFIQASRWFS